MNDLIKTLANARQVEAKHKTELQRVNDEAAILVQDRYGDQLKEIGTKLAFAQNVAQEVESAIRLAALDSYGENGDKHPHTAVTIKVYTRLDYDPETAFTYCTHHLTVALRMDKRKFEKVAKAAGLVFVDTVDEPRATIKRDLSAYL